MLEHGYKWLALLLVLGQLSVAFAEEGGYKKSQYFRGLSAKFRVTQVLEDDLDGDGSKEAIVAYREQGDAVSLAGGLLILSLDGGDYKVAWHGLFEKAFPKKISLAGSALSIDFVQVAEDGQKTFSRTWTKGKDFFFREEDQNPFTGAKVTASSTLKREGISAANVLDRELRRAWAEGAEGTGVDERLTIEFKKPVDLGVIGVLHGNYQGPRDWKDNNRVHRAEVTVETSADRFDTESDVDLESDLGLGLYGDRVELSFSNKPVLRYFKLEKKAVMSLEFKITSVLLGEKNDDAYLAEIDLAEWVPLARLKGEEPAAAKADKKETPPPETKKGKAAEPEDDEDF